MCLRALSSDVVFEICASRLHLWLERTHPEVGVDGVQVKQGYFLARFEGLREALALVAPFPKG